MSDGIESESTDPKWEPVAEPTVPVPVSLIERLLGNRTTDTWNELRALLSQPTPSAEPPMCGAISALTNDPCVEDAGHNGRHMSIRGFSWEPLARWEAPATPPSIADMVPGTTFRARVGAAQGSNFLMVIEDPAHDLLVDSYGQDWTADDIDPPTIRDVTPPGAAQ